MFKFKSIVKKLCAWVSTFVFLAIGVLVGYSSYKTREIAIQAETERAKAIAQSYAHQITAKFASVMDISRTLANTFSNAVYPDGPVRLTREDANRIIRTVLERNEFMFGAWSCWEPNAFDGNDAEYVNRGPGHDATGRYLPYFTRDAEGNIRLEPCTAYEESNEYSGWYQRPKKTLREMVAPPWEFEAQGKKVMMVSSSAPIVRNGGFYGVAGGDITVGWLQEFAEGAVSEYGNHAVMSIYSHNGTVAAVSGEPERVGASLEDLFPDDYQTMIRDIQRGKAAANLGERFLTVQVPVQLGETGEPWRLQLQIDKEYVTAKATAMMVWQIVLGAFILLFSVLVIALVVRGLIQPLIQLVRTTEKVGRGNLAQEIDIDQADEIGALADRFREMIEKLKEIIGEIQQGASRILSASLQLSSTSQQLSEGASEQAAAIEEISSSMEQMSSNISQNADNARQTESIAQKAASDILDGKKAVDETLKAMREIASEITIINEISTRTDMLAINAAIEASKADAHGKGFATVASQVKTLSEKTQTAASRIDKLSGSSIRIAEDSSKLLEKVVPDIQNTHNLVQEISAASIEQNSGASQINDSVYQLNQVVQQNAAAAEEMSASAGELASQAERLNEIIAFFRVDEDAEEDVELTDESQRLIEAFIEQVKRSQVQKRKSGGLSGGVLAGKKGRNGHGRGNGGAKAGKEEHRLSGRNHILLEREESGAFEEF